MGFSRWISTCAANRLLEGNSNGKKYWSGGPSPCVVLQFHSRTHLYFYGLKNASFFVGVVFCFVFFSIASKFSCVSYTLFLCMFLNTVIRIQITYCLPLTRVDLCCLFLWKINLYPIFPLLRWPYSKSEVRFGFEYGFWPIYVGL